MIDWKRVAELRDEVGAEDFDDIISLFLEEVEETLEGLHQIQDVQTLREQLHFIKGSALNMGFETVAQLCDRGEHQKVGGHAAIDTHCIRDSYQTSKSQVFAQLPTAFTGSNASMG